MKIDATRIGKQTATHAAIYQGIVRSILTAFSVSVLLAQLCSSQSKPLHAALADQVNPMIGTGGDPDDGINTFPGASRPFGMVQLSPDTEDHGAGYHHIQARIKGFSMTHMSGAGCSNEGDVAFTATTGPIVTRTTDFQTPYSHAMETAKPGYYQVKLLQWGINAELTATERTGVARFTFPADQAANIILPISRTLNNTQSASIRVVGDRAIEGYVENHAFCTNKQTYKVYFVMAFDRPFTNFGTWTGDQYEGEGVLAPGSRAAAQVGHQEWAGAYATWPAQSAMQTITAKVGISYVDIAGAERNLNAEAADSDFDTLHKQATASWNNELATIQVEGGTAAQRTVFYTALYHSLLMPSILEDSDGRYLGFDGQIHTAPTGRHIYANFSGWDIYRSEIPLLALIEPRRMEDMAQSIVLMFQQGGWIDRWPQINLYTNDMVGSPLTIALSTAWLNGLRDFDINSAYEGMLKDATQAPPPGKPYLGEDGVEWLNKVHYVPSDKVEYGSVAKTLEYSVAYASLARVAKSLGKADDAALLRERALYYRNLFNPADKFLRPRNADGSWVADFNPMQDNHGFVEGTGWHYQSFAPADMAWLVNAVGRDEFNRRMTEFFRYPAPGWYAQYYNPLNETDLQAPFVFNFSGQPWNSQRVVRRILREDYTTAPDGIPGNDDCGAMSSWAVLAMMGIYSVDPASGAYELVAPTFSRVTVRLQQPYSGKAFTIAAPTASSSAQYIQGVQLNHHALNANWIPISSITSGGALQFAVGATPNQAWGSAPQDAPPSISNEK